MGSYQQLLELCDRIHSDPNNAGYWFLLFLYDRDLIVKALDELDQNTNN